MQLKRIILPEIILGRRGHPKIIQLYQDFSKEIEMAWDESTGRKKWLVPGYKNPASGVLDENLGNHQLLCKIFREQGGKTYYLNKDFAQALSRIDREIPIDVLPKKFVGYLQFAEGALVDDTGEVDGALVWIDTLENMGYGKSEEDSWSDIGIAISYGNTGTSPELGPPSVCKLAAAIKRLYTIEGLYDSVDSTDSAMSSAIKTAVKGYRDPTTEDVKDVRLPIFRAIVNAVVYIHSADPEIDRVAPLSDFSNKRRAELKKTQPIQNHLSLPITLLNWKFHSEVVYSVDQTRVTAHMRWQRCGPKNSQVKLILVREHIRNYRKETQDDQTITQDCALSNPADYSTGPVHTNRDDVDRAQTTVQLAHQ